MNYLSLQNSPPQKSAHEAAMEVILQMGEQRHREAMERVNESFRRLHGVDYDLFAIEPLTAPKPRLRTRITRTYVRIEETIEYYY